MNRVTKLKLNIVSALLFQVLSIVSGFVLPRLIIGSYGSEVNGVVSAITQFLSLISLCECGVGAVVQSALYRPLAENDMDAVSRIYVSSTRFFRKIALILLGYVAVLICIFPYIQSSQFDFLFTATLIGSIAVGTMAQHYFGITHQLILNAAQLTWVQMTVRILCLLANVALSVVLMVNGASIQWVKLASSLIFLVQPLAYIFVVSRRYRINKRIRYTEEPIAQKWNGMAQHAATVVFENTPVLVVTVLSTLQNVSVYGAYHMVTNGLKMLFISVTTGMRSYLGDLFARGEKERLERDFGRFEWMMHAGATLVFTVTAILIVPFVSVYTAGITDADYIQPLFAALLCFAFGVYTVRLPYNQMIQSAGHFKETQASAIIEAVLNLVLSVSLVWWLGLLGVGIAAAVSMVYRTVYFVWYLSKHILHRPPVYFVRQAVVDLLCAVVAVVSTLWISLPEVSFGGWLLMALEVFGICLAEMLLIHLVCNRSHLLSFLKRRKFRG